MTVYVPSPDRTVIVPPNDDDCGCASSPLSFRPRDPNEVNSDFWLDISALLAEKNASLRQMSADITYGDGVMRITGQVLSGNYLGILTSVATPGYNYTIKFGALVGAGSTWYFFSVALPIIDAPLNPAPSGDVSANGASLLFNGKTLPGRF